MVVIIVHGLVDVPYFKNDLAVMFWALVAMISAQCLTHNKRNETQKHENTENTWLIKSVFVFFVFWVIYENTYF